MSFIIDLIMIGLVVLIDLILKIIASPLWLFIIIPGGFWVLYMIGKYGIKD